MSDLRFNAFVATTGILLLGTAYSINYSTSLDTSNPLLTHLPHPLHETNYFADKKNLLNVIFIKNAWGWTTAAFALLFATAPTRTRSLDRLLKYGVETLSWLMFTGWFFGPSLIERGIVISGGECVLVLPNDDTMNVPAEYCFTRSTLSPATHPTLFGETKLVGAGVENSSVWSAKPRLRRGHDVSGHIFLLTMSILFLADQIMYSYRSRERWSGAHKMAVTANCVLVSIWLFATYTTSVYFHSPFEKFTGYLLGLLCFSFSQARIIAGAPVPVGTVSNDNGVAAVIAPARAVVIDKKSE